MPIAVWLVASSSSDGLINADRFLGRTGLASGMSCVFAEQLQSKREIVWLDQFDRCDIIERLDLIAARIFVPVKTCPSANS
jgi:hypothetical protein